MKLIPLTKGYHAIVDDEDFEAANKLRWYASVGSGRKPVVYVIGYIKANGGNPGYEVRLHRFLMNPPDGLVVDHINHNGLDNRRKNLRVCTHAQNVSNCRFENPNGFRGITKSRGKYRAQLSGYRGSSKHIGYFDTAEDAATAYDVAAKAARGEFALLNFPKDTAAPLPQARSA